jgi:hypothetical protein
MRKTTEGGWRYPFGEHDRWMYWAQNTCERHRINTQKSVYIKNHPDDANMSEAELGRIVYLPDRGEFNKLLGRMQMYNANIIDSKHISGMPTMWFTLSCADNHWGDLHRILVGLDSYPEACNTEKKKAEHRRKIVRDNPHIVDAFFHRRIQVLLDKLFGSLGLVAEWTWFRIQYQGSGAAQAHGCLRLTDDPGLSTLASKVIVGRAAQRKGNFRDVI